MQAWLAPYYSWYKVFHVFFMISWMLGLLYMPRLFVYHSMTAPGSEASQIFLTMEERLSRIIMTPGLLLTFFFGGVLLYIQPFLLSAGWMHVKLALLLLLAAFHGFLMRCKRRFASSERPYSERFFRFLNEIPALFLFIILFLVFLRPF